MGGVKGLLPGIFLLIKTINPKGFLDDLKATLHTLDLIINKKRDIENNKGTQSQAVNLAALNATSTTSTEKEVSL